MDIINNFLNSAGKTISNVVNSVTGTINQITSTAQSISKSVQNIVQPYVNTAQQVVQAQQAQNASTQFTNFVNNAANQAQQLLQQTPINPYANNVVAPNPQYQNQNSDPLFGWQIENAGNNIFIVRHPFVGSPINHSNYTFYWDSANNYYSTRQVSSMPQSVNNIIQNAQGVINTLLPNVTPITDTVSGLLQTITSNNSNQINNAISGIQTQLNNFMSSANSAQTINPDKLITNVLTNINGLIDNKLNSISPILSNVYDGVGNVLNNYGITTDKIVATLTARIDSLLGIVSSQATNFAATQGHTIDDILSSIFQGQKEQIAAQRQYSNDLLGHIEQFIDDRIKEFTAFINKCGGNVKTFVVMYIEEMSKQLLAFTEPIRQLINVLKNELVNDLGSANSEFTTLYNNIINGKFNNISEVFSFLQSHGANTKLLDFALKLSTVIPLVLSISSAYIAPMRDELQYLSNAEHPIRVLESSTLLDCFFKRLITKETLYTEHAKLGISKSNVDNLVANYYAILPVSALQEGFQRGLLSVEEHDLRLSKLGYNSQDIEIVRTMYNHLQSPSELMQLANNNSFNGEIINKFGLLSEYPDILSRRAALSGYSDNQMRELYTTRWNHLGNNQAIDLYFRGKLSQADLDDIFKLNNVLPYFRSLVVESNRPLLTYRQLIQMYGHSIIDKNGLITGLIKLGYSFEDANKIAVLAATVSNPDHLSTTHKAKELSVDTIISALHEGILTDSVAFSRIINLGFTAEDARTLIDVKKEHVKVQKQIDKAKEQTNKLINYTSQSYLKGQLPRAETVAKLIELGYTPEQANKEIELLDIEYDIQYRDSVANNVKELYLSHLIDKVTAINMFNSLGFMSSEYDVIISELDLQIENKSKKPSLAQFEKGLKLGLISIDEYEQELVNLNYNPKYIPFLTALHTNQSSQHP